MSQPTDPHGPASTVWNAQSVWSQAASRARRQIARARALVLGLTVAAAILGTASAQLAGPAPVAGRILAVVAAVALGLVPIAARDTGREAVQSWTRLRSVSESLKADVYEYLAGVSPFTGANRDTELLARLDGRLSDAGDLLARTTEMDPVERDLPPVTDVSSYIEHRLDPQIHTYYKPAARVMAHRAALIRRVTTTLSATAATLTAIVGVLGWSRLTAWIGVVTTVTTALTGYGAAQRYEAQQLEFARTAGHLDRLRAGRQAYTDDAFVAECEQVISVSTDGWMARLTRED